MNIEKVIEIHKRCNTWFYGFESEIKIEKESILFTYSGVIELELCRINLAFFILELLEETSPIKIEMDFSNLEINRDDFYELIIEIGIVLTESNIEYAICLSNKDINVEIIREYNNIFLRNVINKNNEWWSIKKDSLIYNENKVNLSKIRILEAWEGEFIMATMNNEKPGIDYKYHVKLV